jgi:hypothetical protein
MAASRARIPPQTPACAWHRQEVFISPALAAANICIAAIWGWNSPFCTQPPGNPILYSKKKHKKMNGSFVRELERLVVAQVIDGPPPSFVPLSSVPLNNFSLVLLADLQLFRNSKLGGHRRSRRSALTARLQHRGWSIPSRTTLIKNIFCISCTRARCSLTLGSCWKWGTRLTGLQSSRLGRCIPARVLVRLRAKGGCCVFQNCEAHSKASSRLSVEHFTTRGVPTSMRVTFCVH